MPNTYGRMVKIHARVVAVREKRVEIRPNIREKMRFWKVEKNGYVTKAILGVKNIEKKTTRIKV